MLMQSVNNRIELLPACPKAWKNGYVSGLCARGGYELCFEWKDSKVHYCTIKAKNDGFVTLLYNGIEKNIRLKAGETKNIKTW